MSSDTVMLDLRALSPDRQVDELKRQYITLRAKHALVRARVGALPVRQYISMLERGYRVALERDKDGYLLKLWPDGSTPRLGLRGAHSIACHSDGRVYTNTTDNRVAVIDGGHAKSLNISPSATIRHTWSWRTMVSGFMSPTAVLTM